jgi:glycerol-3-phosphate dehydrogenase
VTTPPAPSGRAWTRADHLSRLYLDHDVIVVGGGVVGAGIALDAITRGLSVLLVDRDDFASGTSSRSTKLFHGGVRYLPQFRFGLVREGLREQHVLAHIADYLTQPFDFVMPIYRGRGFADAPKWVQMPVLFPIAVRLGLWFYDRLGGRHHAVGQRKIDVAEVKRRFPTIKTEGLTHALVYRDYQTDDARLVMALARTAAVRGATAVNWMEAVAIRQAGDAYEVDLEDRLGGASFTVRGRTVVAATGAFAPPPGSGKEPIGLLLSKGAHLVVDPDALGVTDSALVLPETSDDRVMFLVPWRGRAIVGTTDTPYRGDPAHPVTDRDDVEYMLDEIRTYLDVGALDVQAEWSGLRALAAKGGTDTAKASREHKVTELSPGYYQVAGGKLTGYRRIAEQVTDRVAKRIGSTAKARTDRVKLAGSDADAAFRAALAERTTRKGLAAHYPERLIERFGVHAAGVLDLIDERPELGETLGDGSWTLAEAVFTARHECTATITDVVQRRTRIAWFTPDHGREAGRKIGEVLAGELGWDDERLAVEMERLEDDLRAEGL